MTKKTPPRVRAYDPATARFTFRDDNGREFTIQPRDPFYGIMDGEEMMPAEPHPDQIPA